MRISYNSFIIGWFAKNIEAGQIFSKDSLVDSIIEQGVNATSTTVKNAVSALISTFNYSPIGSMLNYCTEAGSSFQRVAYDDVTEIGLAYSLYKYAEVKGIRSLRVSDFFSADCESGPHRVLGIEKSTFERTLRALNSASNRVLIAELNMGLDNISLRDDLNSISLLESLLK